MGLSQVGRDSCTGSLRLAMDSIVPYICHCIAGAAGGAARRGGAAGRYFSPGDARHRHSAWCATMKCILSLKLPRISPLMHLAVLTIVGRCRQLHHAVDVTACTAACTACQNLCQCKLWHAVLVRPVFAFVHGTAYTCQHFAPSLCRRSHRGGRCADGAAGRCGAGGTHRRQVAAGACGARCRRHRHAAGDTICSLVCASAEHT